MDKLAKRLLPLATLLRLSLIFPDQAPSRFKVALRASTVPTRNASDAVGETFIDALSEHYGPGHEPDETGKRIDNEWWLISVRRLARPWLVDALQTDQILRLVMLSKDSRGSIRQRRLGLRMIRQ